MKILGIDPGFGRMGYAVVEAKNKKQKLIKAGCIETSPCLKKQERLLKIGETLEQIIKQYRPKALAIEKLFFFKNRKTALEVAEAKGMVLYIAGRHNLIVYELAPLELKSALCGDGRADKAQMKKMIKILLGLDKVSGPDDTIDAIALALTIHSFSKD